MMPMDLTSVAEAGICGGSVKNSILRVRDFGFEATGSVDGFTLDAIVDAIVESIVAGLKDGATATAPFP
jgi:hypothetical protein